MTAPTAPSSGSAQAAPEVAWFALSPDEAASRLGVDPAIGLTATEADARRATYGPNAFAERRRLEVAAVHAAVRGSRCSSCSWSRA